MRKGREGGREGHCARAFVSCMEARVDSRLLGFTAAKAVKPCEPLHLECNRRFLPFCEMVFCTPACTGL